MKYFITILMLTLSVQVNAVEKLSVLFVNPSIAGEPFWTKVQKIMEVSAAQHNVKLDVIYGEGNRYIQLAELKKYLKYRATPDYVVLLNYPGGAEQSMSLLEQFDVKFITLEQTIAAQEKAAIGQPKQIYKNWLGEIYHDNFKAGKVLAEALITKAIEQKLSPQIVAINGHYGSESDSRSAGLIDYLKQHNLQLNQTVYASWSKLEAMSKTEKLLQRYPNTNVIWTASDLMALGAFTAVKDKDQPFFIGGFDWLRDNLLLIKRKKLTASVGGHYLMGGWALVTLVDHHSGNTFWQNNNKIEIDLGVITQDNIAQYDYLIDIADWSFLDFKRLSLFESKQDVYKFDVAQLRKDKQQNKN
ncbi:ABC transporter substrate-binding protein [Pseudoalteromonas shioyasakiensis]|uniref:ABC transporter substrate-binding protein n=1 Tax=Pseudoalteromonas shioyasakiensis TaxID=1190813 RepID=UPI00211860CB|nr:ABC transporter substrate-binding protein [Pseudoalteromonas shioyasakiensis]MCQ8878412.1 ABC transporter substrate-binding protein [Pseudoalteromonas shioyasakiensis]